MKNASSKIAAVLAFVIGAMAIFAGGQVLMGKLPDYYVIDWLPIYNFTIGLTSAFFASFVIWKNGKLSLPASLTTFSLHALVMLVLQTAYREVVAPDSIRAMTVRILAWLVISALIMVQKFTDQKATA